MRCRGNGIAALSAVNDGGHTNSKPDGLYDLRFLLVCDKMNVQGTVLFSIIGNKNFVQTTITVVIVRIYKQKQ